MKCGEKKSTFYFYRSYIPIHNDELLPICKECLRTTGDTNINDTTNLRELLRNVNRPFIADIWETSIKEATGGENKKSVTGVYFKNINLSHSRNLTWEDSVFEATDVKITRDSDKKISRKELDELEVKWGTGYTPEELLIFDKKYNSLVSNYPVNTSLHEEALRTYVRYQVRAEIATARGDAREAKTWGDLAQKQGEIAKINLNKLTKSDLSQGLDSFSQLSRMVEQEVDIIPILPKFIERPNDKIDLAILSFINYERRLHGLQDVDYPDIYDFYQAQLKEYMEDDTKSPEIKKHIKKIKVDSVKGKKEILFYDVYSVIEEKKKQYPNNGFIQNLDKWMEFVSWSRWNLDLWFDLISPNSGGIKLDVDQRFVLRCLARFKFVYCVFPRGWSKTMIELMYNYHTAIFYPDIELTMTAQTKENASALVDSKWREVAKFYPLISSELNGEPKISKDKATVNFKSGGSLDTLPNGQGAKGQRRKRMAVEEFAQVNNEVFEDCLEPVVNIPRITLGKYGTISPYELNGQILYLTTSWYVGTDAYEKSIDMTSSMVELKGDMILGSKSPNCFPCIEIYLKKCG